MLIAAILIGLLYALPNLYGEDPAVQITGARGIAASEQTLGQVHNVLEKIKSRVNLLRWKMVRFLLVSIIPIFSFVPVKY